MNYRSDGIRENRDDGCPPHHYVIEPVDARPGTDVQGTCKRCGDTRMYPKNPVVNYDDIVTMKRSKTRIW